MNAAGHFVHLKSFSPLRGLTSGRCETLCMHKSCRKAVISSRQSSFPEEQCAYRRSLRHGKTCVTWYILSCFLHILHHRPPLRKWPALASNVSSWFSCVEREHPCYTGRPNLLSCSEGKDTAGTQKGILKKRTVLTSNNRFTTNFYCCTYTHWNVLGNNILMDITCIVFTTDQNRLLEGVT